jgi:proteasome lid subunit RPN8/RPN11
LIVLAPAARAAVEAHAVEGYPAEVCGLLVGRRRGEAVEVGRADRGRNTNTDRARDRYDLDPRDWIRADRAARADGLEIVGVYHSHPDHPARPSTTDLERAWPDLVYLIVAVERGSVVDATAWVLRQEDGAPRGFIEVEIEIVRGG